MNIKIGNLTITSDNRQYMVSVVKLHKTGKHVGQEFTRTLGYYTSFEGLKEGLKEILTKRSKATSIAELKSDRKDIELQVEALFSTEEVVVD